MSPQNSISSKARKGFTLIEIMAATVVMSLVMILVLQLVSFVMGSWNHSTANLEASGRAQFAMEMMEKELESLAIRDSSQNYEFLRAIYKSDTSNKPSGMPAIPTTQLLVLPTPADSSDGAVQCVCYQVIRQNPLRNTSSGMQMFGLYRAKASARATLKNAYVDKGSSNQSGLENMMQAGNRTDSGDTQDEIDASDPEGRGNLLVPNVYSLRLIPYYKDTNGIIKPFEGTDNDPEPIENTLIIDAANKASILNGVTNRDIAYIDIVMTLLTEEGASFLQALDNGYAADPESWDDWLMRNTYTFTRRVTIPDQGN